MRDGRVLGKPAALVREDLVRQRAHHDQSRRLPKPASQTVALRVCHQVASSRRGPPIACCPAKRPTGGEGMLAKYIRFIASTAALVDAQGA